MVCRLILAGGIGGRVMENERDLQDYLLRKAKFNGVYARKMQAVGHTGFPDVMMAIDGRVVFIELKNPNGNGVLSQKQYHEIGRMLDAGLPVMVMHTKEEVDALIVDIVDA